MTTQTLAPIEGPFNQYLLVTDNDGNEWIQEIKDDELLDLETLISKWIQIHYGEDCSLCRPFDSTNKIFGDFYAVIITDGRPPDTLVIWEGAYFFVNFDEK